MIAYHAPLMKTKLYVRTMAKIAAAAIVAAGSRGCGKSQNRRHSEERSDEESLFLRAFKLRGIPSPPRRTRDDGVYAFFRNLLSRASSLFPPVPLLSFERGAT